MPTADENLLFTETHEYVYLQGGGRALIGLSPEIAEGLEDIICIEAHTAGEELSAGDTFATIVTHNGEYELNMPVSGIILSSNEELADRPDVLKNENLDISWILEIEMSDEGELANLSATLD